MGNDGGSIPDRRDLVRTKRKAEQADKANQTRARWFHCALSKKPLREPIVSDALGKLYNKDAILEFLLDRGTYGDGEDICGHIKSLKDVKTLSLTPISASTTSSRSNGTGADDGGGDRPTFLCPLTQKEMTGHVPFVYLSTCGCVMSHAGLRALVSSPPPPPPAPSAASSANENEAAQAQLDVCPQCAKKFDRARDVRTINPAPEEEERMRDAWRAAVKAKSNGKKRKAAPAVTDSSTDASAAEPPTKAKKVSHLTTSTSGASIAAASSAVRSSLAMEEAKRRAGMSDAVKSLYGDKNAPKRKETFMTMGTFTRYA